MPTITETLQQNLTPDTIQAVSRSLGVDEETAQRGIQVALPLLVTALSRNASTSTGAQSLTTALEKDHDGTVLAHIERTVEQPNTTDATGILGHIFGGKLGNIEQAITDATGLNGAQLLQILAPLVMGALGKMMRDQGMGAGGVAGALQDEQQQYEQNNGGLMQIIYQLLDTNKDGSIFDEVTGMLGRWLSSRK